MKTFKSFREVLDESLVLEAKPIKKFKVGRKSTAIITKKGTKFAVEIDGNLLDDNFKSAKEAEKAATEFADLMGA